MNADEAPSGIFHLSLEFLTSIAVRPGRRLNIHMHGLFDSDQHDAEDIMVAIWGTPALDGRLTTASELAQYIRNKGLESLAARLDCSFLLIAYDRRSDQLSIVTDRTASLPLYYHHADNGRFLASSSFKRLFDARGNFASPGFDPWTVAEFLYFRRVFNTRTYDSNIAFLPYAKILTVEADGTTKQQNYWRIGADKLTLNQDALAERLADALSRSMQTYMSDRRKFGLLLSGGLDARAILAASPYPPICFTTTPKPNNELAVASELAAIRGAEHIYVPRPEHLLNNAVTPSVALSGGMTIFSEVQFIDYGPQILPKADTLFMGLALDIMFCGHYLPKSLISFAGKTGWHFRLHKLADDFAELFMDTASYRLKTTNPMRVIRAPFQTEMRARLIDRVRLEMDEGRALGLRDYDLWEFAHLHNLARHYSLLMAQSVRTFAACRLPALTNDLYDLCWGMRATDKANWVVYQKAISRINPAIMRIRNANTNIRADIPLWRQSIIKYARALGSRVPGLQMTTSPSWWDRSWPEPRQAIDSNPDIQARVRALAESEQLAAVGLFDTDAIRDVVAEHLQGTHDHTIMLNALITIDEALRPYCG